MSKRGLLALLALFVAALASWPPAAAGTMRGGAAVVARLRPCRVVARDRVQGRRGPDVLIASDLPLQGSSRTQTIQIVGAIRYLLDQQSWKAGDYNVAFQSCDDSTAQAGKWDSGKCSQNAKAYCRERQGRRVIGTFNSVAPRSSFRC